MTISSLIIGKQHRPLKKKNSFILLIAALLILFCQFSLEGSQSGKEDPETFLNETHHTIKRAKKTHPDSKKSLGAEDDHVKNEYAQEENVVLERGKKPRSEKINPDNYFWKILYQNKRAGKVSIDLIDDAILGKHASIQIFLNKAFQGKHIGRIAYSKACNLSPYDEVYASMRKNNIASYKSSLAAGFKEVKDKGYLQRLMKWVRIR